MQHSYISVNELRDLFIGFFVQKNHKFYSSASLIPINDPSLIFTNAGMVPFKQIFIGLDKSPDNSIVSYQKCLRVGGKHNDLENVGHTTRHHTFFEMLGNFSFGSYFKDQAIELAWNFLTRELKLNKERLYITVYHDDEEAFKLWQNQGISSSRIIKISTDDNFWSMGPTGPCGPCSEIFYDNGDHLPGELPGNNTDTGERFVEIWNLVFMQYDRDENGVLHKLPSKCIDTGMGIERISAVLQGTHDNYEIDLFKALIQRSQHITNNNSNLLAHRIISDHTRAAAFLISENITPGNEGRSYVLRRIIRRATRYAYQLGYNGALLAKVFMELIDKNSPAYMGGVYPELINAQELIEMTLKLEEENFIDTLERGLYLIEKETKHLVTGDIFSGNTAFKLYDTYGFPLDITLDIIKEKGLRFDQISFDQSMNEQKEKARKNWLGLGAESVNKVWFDALEKFGATNFVGYESLDVAQTKVLLMVDEKNNIVNLATPGMQVKVLLSQTSCYAESGGQEGDSGVIIVNYRDNVKVDEGYNIVTVLSTKKILNKLFIHECVVQNGSIAVDDIVIVQVDSQKRKRLRANHSATHLLHHVLRKVVGKHVSQKGSLVSDKKLRFDFTHNEPLSQKQLTLIEDEVNDMIRANNLVNTHIKEIKSAISDGAMALFGEKYEDKVRVVSIGPSKELCGGTHVQSTGEIGLFKIISESSIAFGIRRIEALTAEEAIKYIRNNEHILQEVALSLKTQPEGILDRIKKYDNERKNYLSQISQLYTNIMRLKEKEFEVLKVGDLDLIYCIFKDIPVNILREFIQNRTKSNNKEVILFVTIIADKAVLVIGVNNLKTIQANALINLVSPILNSKGGGNTTLAQISSNSNIMINSIFKIREEILTNLKIDT